MDQVVERKARTDAIVEAAVAAAPATGPSNGQRAQAREMVALYLISALFMAALALLLLRIVEDSAAQFGAGIRIAEDAYRHGAHPTAMARRIFLLASGHHIVAFKAAAFVISAGIIVFGAFFVLKGVHANYRLSTERLDMRSSLATASPGLVIITFGALLAGVTLMNQSHLREAFDYDVGEPAQVGVGELPKAAVNESPRVSGDIKPQAMTSNDDRANRDEIVPEISKPDRTSNDEIVPEPEPKQ